MMDGGTDISTAEPRSERKRWAFLGLAIIAQVSLAVIRIGIPVLVPFIKGEFNLSNTGVGLISSFLNGGAATAGIPAGRFTDRVGERIVLGYGTIASGILVLGVFGLARYSHLLFFFFLIGFMTTTIVPAGGKAVMGWFSRNERGTAMGLRQMAIPLGGAIAAIVLPSLALFNGWRFALAAAGILSVVVGLTALCFYREPIATVLDGSQGQAAGVRAVLKRREFRALLLYAVVMSVGQWFYLVYLVLFLTENLHLSIVAGAHLLATGQAFGGGGRVLWGVISDRLFAGKRKPVLLLVAGVAILTSVLCSVLSPESPMWAIILSVACLGLSLQGWNGLTHTLATELAGSQSAGLAVGITNSSGFIGVMTLTPILGFLIDWYGSYSVGWFGVAAMVFIAVLALAWIKEAN